MFIIDLLLIIDYFIYFSLSDDAAIFADDAAIDFRFAYLWFLRWLLYFFAIFDADYEIDWLMIAFIDW